MFTSINGHDYLVQWHHKVDRQDNTIVYADTKCLIYKSNPKHERVKLLTTGCALCNINADNYNKNTGRKLSLNRALHNIITFSSNDRAFFWDDYREMRGGKW